MSVSTPGENRDTKKPPTGISRISNVSKYVQDETEGPPSPSSLRIAIADANDEDRTALSRHVQVIGHVLHSASRNGRELVDACRHDAPDLMIVDVRMPQMDGFEAIEALSKHVSVPTILVSGHTAPEWIERAKSLGVMAFLMKPVSELHLPPAIALARQHFDELRSLRREAAELRLALDERKVIERAKEALAIRVRVTEAEAYRRMRTHASKENRKLIEVARRILMGEEVFKVFDNPASE